jgi:predicted 3-demethylubiquinone-9 3-methyltransferase (glyoxalase superfamily)
MSTTKIRTCLWFNGQGEDAARFYCELIPGSSVDFVNKPNPDAPALIVEFTLAGVPYMALNGGPNYTLSPATSIVVRTADQKETDHLWNSLTKDGGEESMCGWLVDRFGVSWQVIPDALPRLMSQDDKAAAGRVMQAMLKMRKIDVATLEAASQG